LYIFLILGLSFAGNVLHHYRSIFQRAIFKHVNRVPQTSPSFYHEKLVAPVRQIVARPSADPSTGV